MHPDGRVQRLRPGDRPRRRTSVRATLAGDRRGRRARRARPARVLAGADGLQAALRRRAVLPGPDAGRDRRPRRALAGAAASRRADWEPVELQRARPRRAANGAAPAAPSARCGRPRRSTSRPCCSSRVPQPVVELSPADAERLGVQHGEEVEVALQRPRACAAAAVVRASIPAGSVFMAEGIDDAPANAADRRRRRRGPRHRASSSARPRPTGALGGSRRPSRPPADDAERARRRRRRPPSGGRRHDLAASPPQDSGPDRTGGAA